MLGIGIVIAGFASASSGSAAHALAEGVPTAITAPRRSSSRSP